ncbi:MAG TPA: hypothetical protein PJ989_00955 [Oligoflexia bacterium]|nr:hypothetical protein [Oligoflexia bacterium]
MRYLKIRGILFIFRAVLFSLVINAPYIWEFIISEGNSPKLFSDSDETVYLRQAYFIADSLPMNSVYKEHANYTDIKELILSHRPDQTLTHLVAGRFAKSLNLSILELNIVLDIFFSIVGYLLFVYFLNCLIPGFSFIRAEIVTILFLSSPWVFSFENYFSLHSALPDKSATLPFMSHSCLPILEGLESQISVIWIIVCLYAWHKSRSGSLRSLILTGILHGLFIYIYVLGWIGAGVLIGVLIILESLLSFEVRTGYLKDTLRRIFVFSVTSLIVSMPGIYIIIHSSIKEPLYKVYENIYSQVWYSPVEWLLFLIIAIFTFLFIRRVNRRKDLYSLNLILIATLISELIVLNLQPLAGFTLCGVYILMMYYRPIATATLFSILILGFRNSFIIRYVFVVFYFLLLGATLYNLNKNHTNNNEFTNDSTELVGFLKSTEIKNKVLVFLSHKNPFNEKASEFDQLWELNAVAAITENYLLYEAIFTPSATVSDSEIIEREMLLGLIYTGTKSLIRKCIDKIETEPKYLFFLQWISVQAARVELCQKTASLQSEVSSCDLIRKYEFDYIILETRLQKELPEPTLLYSSLVWTSKNREYEIYKVDKNQAIEHFCK